MSVKNWETQLACAHCEAKPTAQGTPLRQLQEAQAKTVNGHETKVWFECELCDGLTQVGRTTARSTHTRVDAVTTVAAFNAFVRLTEGE